MKLKVTVHVDMSRPLDWISSWSPQFHRLFCRTIPRFDVLRLLWLHAQCPELIIHKPFVCPAVLFSLSINSTLLQSTLLTLTHTNHHVQPS
jgi:hypothetical protein